MNSLKFDNKKVLIFGGASGIGAACAVYFKNEGAAVIVIDRNQPADFQCDIGIYSELTECFKSIQGADIVVNCAGVYTHSDASKDFFQEDIDKTVQTNLVGAMYISQVVMPLLTSSGGSLIHVSSALGIVPEKESPIYCATKAGLNMLVKALALSGADHKVRVNAVCPGPIDTPLLRNAFPDETALNEYLSSRPFKRAGRPEEVASLIGFLASAEAGYITGGIYTVDGGESLM